MDHIGLATLVNRFPVGQYDALLAPASTTYQALLAAFAHATVSAGLPLGLYTVQVFYYRSDICVEDMRPSAQVDLEAFVQDLFRQVPPLFTAVATVTVHAYAPFRLLHVFFANSNTGQEVVFMYQQ